MHTYLTKHANLESVFYLFFLYGIKHTKQDFKTSSEMTVLTLLKVRKLDQLPEFHSAASLIPVEKANIKESQECNYRILKKNVCFFYDHINHVQNLEPCVLTRQHELS